MSILGPMLFPGFTLSVLPLTFDALTCICFLLLTNHSPPFKETLIGRDSKCSHKIKTLMCKHLLYMRMQAAISRFAHLIEAWPCTNQCVATWGHLDIDQSLHLHIGLYLQWISLSFIGFCYSIINHNAQ